MIRIIHRDDVVSLQSDAAVSYAMALGVRCSLQDTSEAEMAAEALVGAGHRWWPEASTASGEEDFRAILKQQLEEGRLRGRNMRRAVSKSWT